MLQLWTGESYWQLLSTAADTAVGLLVLDLSDSLTGVMGCSCLHGIATIRESMSSAVQTAGKVNHAHNVCHTREGSSV